MWSRSPVWPRSPLTPSFGKSPVGKFETTYKIEKLDDLREIKLRCQSGYYSRWFLTPAQDSTFVDVEVGVEPPALQYRLLFRAMGKRYLRRIAEQAIDGLRAQLAHNPPRSASPPGAPSSAAATSQNPPKRVGTAAGAVVEAPGPC
jgi:hypothetical protein